MRPRAGNPGEPYGATEGALTNPRTLADATDQATHPPDRSLNQVDQTGKTYSIRNHAALRIESYEDAKF